jgi:hypothetical protein
MFKNWFRLIFLNSCRYETWHTFFIQQPCA